MEGNFQVIFELLKSWNRLIFHDCNIYNVRIRIAIVPEHITLISSSKFDGSSKNVLSISRNKAHTTYSHILNGQFQSKRKTIAGRSWRSEQEEAVAVADEEEEAAEKSNATWKWHKAIWALNRALSFSTATAERRKN